ncbi:MAG: hypothetical protein ACKV19_11580 [Verrucomicrobiales bacterium]
MRVHGLQMEASIRHLGQRISGMPQDMRKPEYATGFMVSPRLMLHGGQPNPLAVRENKRLKIEDDPGRWENRVWRNRRFRCRPTPGYRLASPPRGLGKGGCLTLFHHPKWPNSSVPPVSTGTTPNLPPPRPQQAQRIPTTKFTPASRGIYSWSSLQLI